MNEKELAEIEARAEAATPGPWKTVGFFGAMEILDSTSTYLDNTDDNAAFIAHARQDVPALVAEVRRLNGDNALLEYMLGERANENDLLVKEVRRLRAALEEIKDYTGPESDIEDGWSHIYHLASEALKGGPQ